MAIDPRHMMNLLAIAEEGSFTRAATRLNLSQPALSTSIAILESRIGTKLLERTFRGAEANEYGDIVVRRAHELRSLIEATEAEVAERVQGRAGPLVIGATPGMFLKMLPDLLTMLKEKHPNLGPEIVEGWDETLEPMLDAGELDFYFGSITSIDPLSPRMIEEELYHDPVAVGVHAESPFLGRPSVSIAELIDEHWVLPRTGAHLRHIEALFAAAGVPWPKLCTRTNSMSLTEALVMRTRAVTIVSHVQVSRPEPHKMQSVPLATGGAKRVAIRRRAVRNPSPAAADALDCLRHIAANMVEARAFSAIGSVCSHSHFADLTSTN